LSGNLRTDTENTAWLCDVAKGLRSGSKTVLGQGRRCRLSASQPCSSKGKYSQGRRQGRY
jgi:hypothetical protein